MLLHLETDEVTDMSTECECSSRTCVALDPSAPSGGTSPRFAQGGHHDA